MMILMKNRTSKITKIVIIIIALLFVIFGVVVFLKRQWILDFFRGIDYQPSSEMAKIRDSLELTDAGDFLFKASRPVLSERELFNEKCRTDSDADVAVLGCYVEQVIFVYDIREEELDGIRELTAAHELLHAVYARMSDEEKKTYLPLLLEIYNKNKDVLEEDVGHYAESQKNEELFVRSGTEIRDLPSALEKKYAETFKDRKRIVSYYESYIAVFRKIEDEMEELKNRMTQLDTEIDSKSTAYESSVTQLNADIISFNSCAEVIGCFSSEAEFNSRRAQLVNSGDELSALYDEIGRMIEEYNQLVDQYNNDLLYGQKLQQIINSNQKPNAPEE